MKIRFSILLFSFLAMVPALSYAGTAAPYCSLFENESATVEIPANTHSILVDRYFRIYFPAGDSSFQDNDHNEIPDILDKQIPVMQKSRYFLETELGWNLPASRSEMGRRELDVYFVTGNRSFSATTLHDRATAIVFQKKVLVSPDFSAIWIHQLTHAAELSYKPSGDAWFYEATAGWMEGQFAEYSSAALKAQMLRMEHPEISLADASPVFSLGASRFMDVLARPNRDVVRQIWDQWSYSRDDKVNDVISNVLANNHLPDLESFLQSFFLLYTPNHALDSKTTEIVLRPFSAAILQGTPDQSTGGIKLTFLPDASTRYATSVLLYSQNDRSGTLSMKKSLTGESSVTLPFAGMDHYRFLIVNSSAAELRGSVAKSFDSTIPGVLEYFRVNAGEGGVQIEWKTARENGVAFWNLYRVENGTKILLNAFPIPAAIHSDEGIHYLFVDTDNNSALYSLEAITSEGYRSPFAGSDTQ